MKKRKKKGQIPSLPLPFDRPLPPDITAKKHKGNKRSNEANKDVAPHKANQRDRIYARAVEIGPEGTTSEELYRPLGIGDNSGSARTSELKFLGKLLRSGRVARCSSGSLGDVLIADIFANDPINVASIAALLESEMRKGA